MKITKFNIIITSFLSLFFCFKSIAQEIENKKASENADTMYVIPKKKNAELSLIVPPNGFVPTEKFNGYLYTQASAAIIMTLIEDVNYIKICEGMTQTYFAQNKLTKISENKFISDNKIKGQIYKCSFVLEGVDYIRIMVFAGDLTKTLWLNITYPSKFEELLGEEIHNSIRSISLNPNKNEAK